MGMLDPILLFHDHFKDSEVFTLQGAKVGDEIQTEYGPTSPAMFKINGKVYSIIGKAIVGQIERMDSSDKAAMKEGKFTCKVVRIPGNKAGNAPTKTLVSADWNGDSAPATNDDISF